MAQILINKDGTYETKCALCSAPLSEPIFATPHFIVDKSNDLYAFSDAAMHWKCYVRWPNQARFASMYFETMVEMSEANTMWPVVWKSSDVLVRYGLMVNEASITLRKSGTDIRVSRRDWQSWIRGEWTKECRPDLEREAIMEGLPQLKKLRLPQSSENGR